MSSHCGNVDSEPRCGRQHHPEELIERYGEKARLFELAEAFQRALFTAEQSRFHHVNTLPRSAMDRAAEA